MRSPLSLLLPAIIPSWNFFDVIAPSPRIEIALVRSPDEPPEDWREFRPRPERVSLLAMMWRMIWSPAWNESLFLVSCAERLVQAPTLHSQEEIFRRIAADLRSGASEPHDEAWLGFRLAFVRRHDDGLTREVLFQSPLRRLADIPSP
ncbi:MAG: hypothetical protein CFE28_09395 [Alphaproteobacteria bacterium PA2]|nr:MAG: hypothetical protein CFE28_09395 [Alphaproteobacteria bacterium PA2]